MPFGLCNAPATFQRLMNHMFRDLLDKGIVLYLDDILVYTKGPQNHTEIVKEVLLRLRRHRLYAKLAKCQFYSPSLSFLGHRIDANGISMEPEKVAMILEWPFPRNAKDVLSFVGLANFYRTFIPHFASICRPLYDIAKKGNVFRLTEEVRGAWEELKRAVASNLVV